MNRLNFQNSKGFFTKSYVTACILVCTIYQLSAKVDKFDFPPISNAKISIENMTKLPGSIQGQPANNHYTFSKIVTPSTSATKWHNTNVMRIHNLGTDTLIVSVINIGDLTKFNIKFINGVSPNNQFPLKIAASTYVDVTLEFVETVGTKGLRESSLTILSNASDFPQLTAVLKGGFLLKPEGGNELSYSEVIKAFGYKTTMTNYGSDYPLPSNVDAGFYGDLILSPMFVPADPSKPVQLIHLACFSGPSPATVKLTDNSNTQIANHAYTYGLNYHQSLFPKSSNTSTSLAGISASNLTAPFMINIGGYTTSGKGGTNPATGLPFLLGVRVCKVKDKNGNIIPFQYLILEDYIGNGCGAGSNNCDWNDNVILLVNAKPAVSPTVSSIADKSVYSNTTFNFDISASFNKGYAGNKLTYSAKLGNGQPLPNWISLNSNTGVFNGTAPEMGESAMEIVITATDLNGLTINTSFLLSINTANPYCCTKKIEAESNYTISNEAGTNAIGNQANTAFSAGQALKILDKNDKVRITFNLDSGGQYKLKVRLRVGSTNNTTAFVNNGYDIKLNNQSLGLTFNPNTLSSLLTTFGGSYWGELESKLTMLDAGQHSLDIEALSGWLAVDYLEVIKLNTPIFTEPIACESKKFEIENTYSIVNEAGTNPIVTSKNTSFSNEKAIRLYDVGDKIKMTFQVACAGFYKVSIKLRVGDVANSTHLFDDYKVVVNNQITAKSLDSSSVSPLLSIFGGSHWGNIETDTIYFAIGEHTIELEALKKWLGVDYFEIIPLSSQNLLTTTLAVCDSQKFESESTYSIVNESGTNVIGGLESMLFSGGEMIKLYDTNDKIKMTFEVACAGQYKVSIRLRTGDASNPTNLANNYKIQLNNQITSVTINPSSISALLSVVGGSYWGNVETQGIYLGIGEHSIDIEALKNWLGVDYFELIPATTASNPIQANRPSPIYQEKIVETKTIELKTYPNPILDDEINVEFSKILTGKVKVALLDNLGKQVYQNEIQLADYQVAIKISTNQLSLKKGLYFLKVSHSDFGNKTIRVMKQ